MPSLFPLHRLVPTVCALALLCSCAPAARTGPQAQAEAAQPPAQSSMHERSAFAADLVLEAARTVAEMRQASPRQMLDYFLEDARAVVILPGIYQAGFFYSLHAGSGVALARRPDGSFGAPVFCGLGGAGFGVQIGLERSRLLLVIRDDDALGALLSNGLHFDAAAKFDVLGVREETSRGSLTEKKPVVAVVDGVGLMAGVALRGGVLAVNQGLTELYHGRKDADAILGSASAPGPEVLELWGALAVSLPKDEISRVRRP